MAEPILPVRPVLLSDSSSSSSACPSRSWNPYPKKNLYLFVSSLKKWGVCLFRDMGQGRADSGWCGQLTHRQFCLSCRAGAGHGGQGRGQIKSKREEKIKLIKLHTGRRSRAPTGDFTVAFGHGDSWHLTYIKKWCPRAWCSNSGLARAPPPLSLEGPSQSERIVGWSTWWESGKTEKYPPLNPPAPHI